MTPDDTFDLRLGEALLAYAADAAVEEDPMRFAAAVARSHPRGRWRAVTPWVRMDWRASWAAVLLLLLAAAAIGAALVGVRLVRDPPHQVRTVVLPDAWFGRWQVGGAGEYLDLGGAALVHGAHGEPLPEFGSVTAFLPDGRSGLDGGVFIHAGWPCGDARYHLRYEDTIADAPAPPDFGAAFRLVDGQDQCGARRSVLADRLWERLAVPLAAGGRYDSLDFREPFHLTLPPDAALGLFSAEVGAMYQFDPTELHFSHAWWNAELIDDVPVFRDVCNHDLGILPDIPGSVDAVGAWLHASQGLPFAPPTELVIDGRRALRWHAAAGCPDGNGPAASDLAAGSEYFAIPTGDDVVLFVVRADTENEAKVAERIALAMDFD